MKGFVRILSVAFLVALVRSQNCVEETLSCDDPVPTIYKLGDQSCPCNSPNHAGALKYDNGKVHVCLGSEWKTIPFEESYGTERNPGLSCKDIKDKAQAAGKQVNNGMFWIRLQGHTTAFPVFCDMAAGGSAKKSCKEIYDEYNSGANMAYMLQMDTGNLPVYCNMDGAGLGGCGGGGWTLVMKIDGAKPTFRYDSPYWTDKNGYSIAEGKTGLENEESKLPSYWNTPFTKICLGMKIGGQTKFILLQKVASSLHSLIADGQFRATSLTLDAWKSLIGSSASLQHNCKKQGFNVLSDRPNHSKVRIGILGNNENDCITSDSRIGFGAWGYPDDNNSCGDVAKHGGDNGDKYIKAMGYIFVQ